MPATDSIPEYLQPFIAKQDPELYTWIDHAVWRFILKISQDYFSKVAHPKYLDGLAETGISTERIPLISEMDEKLRRFGWRAIGVSGFIPPAVFMEFQSLGVLPIACEMRTLDHLAYTPAPDIVHEAAGHAPIIADPNYAEYLKNYGQVARKAISSQQDHRLYLAIRELSDVKENPEATTEQINRAQIELDSAISAQDYTSEASYLARMNWWTVEYGLMGDLSDPKIYGAGLLSSVSESYQCLKDSVLKVPLTLDCVNTSYDITRPQPQLFVARDFSDLNKVLNEFAETMAFRKGGVEGLTKALRSGTVTTAVLDSGLQISGVLKGFSSDPSGNLRHLQWKNSVQLAIEDFELPGHGIDRHSDGYSTILGTVLPDGRCLSRMEEDEIQGLIDSLDGVIRFESGVTLKGRVKSILREKNRTQVITFLGCEIRDGENVLYRPEWGEFDLGCGSKVVSVFGGPADRLKYPMGLKPKPQLVRAPLRPEAQGLNELYGAVREIRETIERRKIQEIQPEERVKLLEIVEILERQHVQDWLLRFECLEILSKWDPSSANVVRKLRESLQSYASEFSGVALLIQRGLASLGGMGT
jgi:phenylalanine-4-hydroxylase